MNTRMHPRTMAQAFGPYTSDELRPMRDDTSYRWHWYALIVIGIVTLVAVYVTR